MPGKTRAIRIQRELRRNRREQKKKRGFWPRGIFPRVDGVRNELEDTGIFGFRSSREHFEYRGIVIAALSAKQQVGIFDASIRRLSILWYFRF